MLALPERAIVPDSIHHADLFGLCNALADASVDMILCDLPYGTTDCSWDNVIPMAPMWCEFRRVIKPRGAIVLTATEPFASHLRMGWVDGYKYDWVWVKSRATDIFRAKLKPMNRTESVLAFSPGTVANGSKRQMNYSPIGTQSIYEHKRHNPRSDNSIVTSRPSHGNYIQTGTNYPDNILRFSSELNVYHPTQKPVALFEYLIKTYTKPGEIVFDPCVGSGTTAVAALRTDRRYICGDFTREYVDIARQRVQNADPTQPTMVSEGIQQLNLFEVMVD